MAESELPRWTERTRRELKEVGDLTTPEARARVIKEGSTYSIETLVAIIRRLDHDDPRHEKAFAHCLHLVFYPSSASHGNSDAAVMRRRIRSAAMIAYGKDSVADLELFFDRFINDYLSPAIRSRDAKHRLLEERFWKRFTSRLQDAVRAVRRMRRLGIRMVYYEEVGREPASDLNSDTTDNIAFKKALESLPEHERRTVLLWLRGHSTAATDDPESIAALEGISRIAVRKRLVSAGKRLTELLDEPFDFVRDARKPKNQKKRRGAAPDTPASREEEE